jgi:NTE family protein
MLPWVRPQRVAMPGRITHAHLLASAAIPFVFPATGIAMPDGHTEFFGDGSMRQAAPLSAAVHLGAERILAIGAGRMSEPQDARGPNTLTGYPTLAQIAGHAMSSIFLDALATDVERTHRVNQTLSLIPPAARTATGLRPVELLVISPSERIDVIASRHAAALPGALRRMIGCPRGSTEQEITQSSALASYLLFDSGFTQELMALGRADTLRQRDAVDAFFGWKREAVASPYEHALAMQP